MQAIYPALVLVAAVFATTLADKVQFKDCGSTLSKIVSLDVTPCPRFPCPFKKNTNVTITMQLQANADVTVAQTKVYGLILGQLVPFPLPDDNACHNMKCPLKSGDTVTYSNFVFVKPEYPKLTLVVKWEVLSGSDILSCFTVPAQISD